MSLEPDPRRATELGGLAMLCMFPRSGKIFAGSSTWVHFLYFLQIVGTFGPDSGTRVTFYGFCKRPLNLKNGLKMPLEP